MKQIYIISALIFLVAALLIFTFSFGLFETSTVRTTELPLGDWVVEVNGTDIVKNETFSIDDMHWNSNANVALGKLAPGVSGYFDVVIDPTLSKVSVRYDVTFDSTELENYDLTFQAVEVNNRTLIRTDVNTYTGVITLSEIQSDVTSTIRCNVTWNNDETKNEEDSIVGTDKNAEFAIPITIKATQYLGETITEYIENN